MISPLQLPQEYVLSQPYNQWRVLICCIFHNAASNNEVRATLDELFRTYPNPHAMHEACKTGSAYLQCILEPLGRKKRRFELIADLTADYLRVGGPDELNNDGSWVHTLRGGNTYMEECINVFIHGCNGATTDEQLNGYILWRQPK